MEVAFFVKSHFTSNGHLPNQAYSAFESGTVDTRKAVPAIVGALSVPLAAKLISNFLLVLKFKD